MLQKPASLDRARRASSAALNAHPDSDDGSSNDEIAPNVNRFCTDWRAIFQNSARTSSEVAGDLVLRVEAPRVASNVRGAFCLGQRFSAALSKHV
jgi:hypothetical protein